MGNVRLRGAESIGRGRRAAALGILLVSIALSGCEYLVGEPDVSAMLDLYNPATHEHKLCGRDVLHSPPSLGDRLDQEDCIAGYEAQGYYLVGDIR
jgi:hypothetical protein